MDMPKKIAVDKKAQVPPPPAETAPEAEDRRPAPNGADPNGAGADHPIPSPDAPRDLSKYARFVVPDEELAATPVKSHTCTWGTPPKAAFIRVHPDQSMRWNLRVFTDEAGSKRKTYLVDPRMRENYRLQGLLKTVKIFPYVTHHLPPKLGLWPVSIGHAENTWVRSACRIALELEREWLMVIPDIDRGEYLTKPPEAVFPDPDWGSLPGDIAEWLDLAFTEADWITPENWADHPVHKKLTGQIRG
jgi:hypothetical protein